MDKTYNSRDARTNWRNVLDLVQGGESVTVTRSGKAVARIVPVVGPAKAGDRWGDLTPEQQAGVPVGACVDYPINGLCKPDGGWTKKGENLWGDDNGLMNDDNLNKNRILTHLPTEGR